MSLKTRDLDLAVRRARMVRVAMDEAIEGKGGLTAAELRARIAFHHADMRATLDDLDLAARRRGTDPARERHLNAVHGWVNLLLAEFGRGASLRFEGDCIGLAFLCERGVADDLVPEIAQEHAVSVRTERQLGAMHAAKADVHAAIGRDGWREVEGEFVARHRGWATALLGQAPPNDTHETVSSINDKRGAIHVSVPARKHEPQQAESNEDWAPEGAKVEEKGERLPLATLARVGLGGEATDDMLTFTDREVHAESTRRQIDGVARLVARFLIEQRGRTTLGEVTQADLGAFMDVLRQIPRRYGQSERDRQLPFVDLIAIAKERGDRAAAKAATAARSAPRYTEVEVEAEAARAREAVVGVTVATRNKYVSHLGTILDALKGKGYAVSDLRPKELRAKRRRGNPRTEAEKPEADALRPLFEIPVYAGFEDEKRQHCPGGMRAMSGAFYAPLFLYYLGARRNEIAGLRTRDVHIENEEVPFIRIAPNYERDPKNPFSHRDVPIPQRVLDLGFAKYVAMVSELGKGRLFPDLYPHGGKCNPGDRLYDIIQQSIRREDDGTLPWKRLLHTLRHTFSSELKDLRISSEERSDITGQRGNGEQETRYTRATKLKAMRGHIELMPNITSHLQQPPAVLLPSVAANTVRPWARGGRGARSNDRPFNTN